MEIYLICNRVGDFEQYFLSFIDAYFHLNCDKKYFKSYTTANPN